MKREAIVVRKASSPRDAVTHFSLNVRALRAHGG